MIVDLDKNWQAIYKLALQDGEIVVAGLEIRPTNELQAGGMTTRLTRTLHPPLAVRVFKRQLAGQMTPGSTTSASREFSKRLRVFAVAAAAAWPNVLIADLEDDPSLDVVPPENVAAAKGLLEAGGMPEWEELDRLASEQWVPWKPAIRELLAGSRVPPQDRLRRLAETATQ